MLFLNLTVSINSLTEKVGSWHASSGVPWRNVLSLEILQEIAYPGKQPNHYSEPLLGLLAYFFILFNGNSFVSSHAQNMWGWVLDLCHQWIFHDSSVVSTIKFQPSDNDWSPIAFSMFLIMVSSTTRELTCAFSEAFETSGHAKSPIKLQLLALRKCTH